MRLIQGSIIDFKGEAIVNPANSHLNHSGGLAAIIARAAKDYGRTHVPITQPHGLHTIAEEERISAMRSEWDAEQEQHPLIATGNAGVTSAGALNYKAIVHAVGPVWNGGHFYEDQLLMSAHRSALRVARAEGITSIAFPAISAGVFGFPIQHVAYNAVRVLSGPDAIGIDVSVYLFEDAHLAAYAIAAGQTS